MYHFRIEKKHFDLSKTKFMNLGNKKCKDQKYHHHIVILREINALKNFSSELLPRKVILYKLTITLE